MAAPDKVLLIRDWRGGMNTTDSPTSLGATQVVDAVDVDQDQSMLGARRRGAAPLGTIWPGTFSGYPAWLGVHVPANQITAAELWTWDKEIATSKLGRLVPGGTGFTQVTVADAAEGSNLHRASAASYAGKFYLAYDSSVDRLHGWDGTQLRKLGLAAPANAPTTSTSSGAATDTRKYRVRAIAKNGSTVSLRSEPSPTTAAIGLSSQRCTVTKPTMPAESETHWELEASSVNSNYTIWYVLGEANVSTSTIEDNNASLVSFALSEETGAYTTIPSVRYVVPDRDRVLFLNAWEDTFAASRVYWTPIIGTATGASERLVMTSSLSSYLDLAPGINGQITGGARFQGSVYVFKDTAIYKLIRTGDAEAPYLPVLVSDAVGAVDHRSIVEGEDEFGNPALYFYGQSGPYRLSQRGVEFLGADLRPSWRSTHLAALVSPVHAVWYPHRRQVWYFVALGAYNAASEKFVFHVDRGRRDGASIRGGWVRHSLPTLVASSCLYSGTVDGLGSTPSAPNPLARPFRPWMGHYPGSPYLTVGDYPDYDQDNDGTPKNFTASLTSQPYLLGAADQVFSVQGVQALARAPSAYGKESRIKVSLIRDWGVQSDATATMTTTWSSSVTQVVGDLEVARGGCTAVQLKVEDGGSPSTMADILEWNVDALTVRYRPEERR